MKTLALFVILSGLLLTGCEKKEPVQTIVQAATPDQNGGAGPEIPGGATETEAFNTFGFDIFKLLIADEPADTNIFISPTSISLALSMTLNGADSATKDSMIYALRMSGLTMDEINQTAKSIMGDLTTTDADVVLEIANSIWYRQGFEVQQNFVEINQEYYDAKIAALDFSSPSALDSINGWVAEKTHDKIPTILNSIEPDHIMFLINAIYFNGTWTLGFNEESTHTATFHINDAEFIEVDMMNFEEEIPYYENDLFQACELDYGSGDYSMLVFLPKAAYNTDTLVSSLSTENWEAWTQAFSNDTVDLHLPRFTFKYEKLLNEALQQMGMGIAFTNLADFTGINEMGGIQIDFVKHKSFVEVNESGTEAAAVTIVGMEVTSAPGYEDPIKHMMVNKPFLFVIREKASNIAVFMGRVSRPVYEE